MKNASEISKDELRNLLNQGWLTHDAMWFYHCLAAFGIEKTNELNRAAIQSMAVFEIKRIKKALDVDEITDFEHLKRFVLESFSLIRPDFMKFQVSFPGENVIHWKTDDCFAHKGMERIGMAGTYECGIHERVAGWLNGLGLSFTFQPDIKTCLMHHEGRCEKTFRIDM